MKLTTLTLLLFCSSVWAQQPDYNRLKADAEKFYSEKSYAKAYELYQQAEGLKLPAAEVRWVSFRLGDTQWRAEAASNTSDSTKFDQARERLEALVRDARRTEDQDRVWVEVQGSLGDFWWRQNVQNWSEAWPHYQKAFDWWGGQRVSEEARARYLQLVWKAVHPPGVEHYYGSYYGNYLPPEILDNAIKLAQDPNDQARAHYYLANQLRMVGEMDQRQRIPEELEAALKAGKGSEWYDDSLYFYGEWMATSGNITQDDNGQWQQTPDYNKALQLFRRLVSEFKKGESR